jgi:hypothetical protein
MECHVEAVGGQNRPEPFHLLDAKLRGASRPCFQNRTINGNQIWYLLVGSCDWREQGCHGARNLARRGTVGMHGGQASGGQRVPKSFWGSLEPARGEGRENASFGRGEGNLAAGTCQCRPLHLQHPRILLVQWHDLPGHGSGRFHLPQESAGGCRADWLPELQGLSYSTR